ncbi:hypothetical protein DL98DRAFT_534765 [Cadophora sp. DSE1049]|nr:hypothetical protein DL98DRAFT_534765 [Cadophora sp. DSE1049]
MAPVVPDDGYYRYRSVPGAKTSGASQKHPYKATTSLDTNLAVTIMSPTVLEMATLQFVCRHKDYKQTTVNMSRNRSFDTNEDSFEGTPIFKKFDVLAGFDNTKNQTSRLERDDDWIVMLKVNLIENANCLQEALTALSKHIDYMKAEQPDILAYLVLRPSKTVPTEDRNTIFILERFGSQEVANRMHFENVQFKESKERLGPLVKDIEGSGYRDVSASVGF